jgi:hypothetical protein
MNTFKELVLNYNTDEYKKVIKMTKSISNDNLEWLKNQSEEGNSNAQDIYGEYFYYVEMNYKEAVKWYTLSAKQENAHGLFNLGYMFEEGRGVSVQDWRKALLLYRKGTELGCLLAHDRYQRIIREKMFNVTEHLKVLDDIFILKTEKRLRKAIDIPEVLIEIIVFYINPLCNINI